MRNRIQGKILVLGLFLFCLHALTIAGVSEAALENKKEGGELDAAAILDDVEGSEFETSDTPSQPKPEPSSFLPDVWCQDIEEETTRGECWKSFRSSFEYHSKGLIQREEVFWWHHKSTQIIFFVVIGLVFAGVYFAWVQFRHDLDAKSDQAQSAEQDHQIELSTSGLKVSSPVLGVIILALSLGFFYLYLVYVYPLQEIF